MNRNSVRKVLKLRKEINLRRTSKDSDQSDSCSVKSKNSFLVEVEHNHDIDSKVRKDIEDKYQRSIMNARYIFPRINPDANCLPKIKVDRRHVSYNDNGLGVIGVGSSKISVDIKGMEENPKGKLIKIPAIVNKSVYPDRRNIPNSNTPGPSYIETKRSTPRDYKRNTPSPVPLWRQSPVKVDKRRAL